MQITFDTENISEQDRAVLAFIASGETDPYAASLSTRPAVSTSQKDEPVQAQTEKPKRSRRTNAEIAFDTAKEAYEAADSAENWNALTSAANELKSKDPDNDRLSGQSFQTADETTATTEDSAPEETPDDAAPESADEPAITPASVKQLASQLITTDRDAAIAILHSLGANKFSELSDDQLPEFHAMATKALKAAADPE
jgi:hypothetical protein